MLWMTTLTTPKDFRGVDIEIGDTIVYPGRHSSSLWLNEMVVTDIVPSVDSYGKPSTRIVGRRIDRFPSYLPNPGTIRSDTRTTHTSILQRVAVVAKAH